MANLNWKQTLLGSAMALSLVAAPAIAQEVTKKNKNTDNLRTSPSSCRYRRPRPASSVGCALRPQQD